LNSKIYYISSLTIFLLLKFIFSQAEIGDLIFLLKPTDTLVGLLTGSQSVYILDNGYYHASLNILLNKSCSGFNFWSLSFLAFAYLAIKYFKNKALAIPVSLCCAYILTIFANSSRIFTAIIVPYKQALVHETIGIIVYLSFLVLVYYLTEEFFKRRRNNAKIV